MLPNRLAASHEKINELSFLAQTPNWFQDWFCIHKAHVLLLTPRSSRECTVFVDIKNILQLQLIYWICLFPRCFSSLVLKLPSLIVGCKRNRFPFFQRSPWDFRLCGGRFWQHAVRNIRGTKQTLCFGHLTLKHYWGTIFGPAFFCQTQRWGTIFFSVWESSRFSPIFFSDCVFFGPPSVNIELPPSSGSSDSHSLPIVVGYSLGWVWLDSWCVPFFPERRHSSSPPIDLSYDQPPLCAQFSPLCVDIGSPAAQDVGLRLTSPLIPSPGSRHPGKSTGKHWQLSRP